jgi:hypothetical protein
MIGSFHVQIKIEEYTAAINQINNTLDDYWPCDFCFYCGYFCCPCTLGLSLFCPNLCISDVSVAISRNLKSYTLRAHSTFHCRLRATHASRLRASTRSPTLRRRK